MGQVEAAAALPGGGRVNERFRAVLNAVVPEAAPLSEGEWHEAQAIMARALAPRPAAVRRQIGLFMRLLDLAALVRHGRTLAALSTDDATHLFEGLSQSKFVLLRRGVWGVRTLAFMGYYARAEAASAIGYRAAAGGWSARRDASAMHG